MNQNKDEVHSPAVTFGGTLKDAAGRGNASPAAEGPPTTEEQLAHILPSPVLPSPTFPQGKR